MARQSRFCWAKFSEEGRSDLHPLYQYPCMAFLAIDLYIPDPKETFTIPDVTYLGDGVDLKMFPAQLFSKNTSSFMSIILPHPSACTLKDPSPCDHYRHFPLPTMRDRQKNCDAWVVSLKGFHLAGSINVYFKICKSIRYMDFYI